MNIPATTVMTAVLLYMLSACGSQYVPEDAAQGEGVREYQEYAPEQPAQSEFSEEEKRNIEQFAKPAEEFLYIRGYISPFEIIVDQEPFSDSEAFYTAHLEKLEAEMDAEGYRDYDLDFNASVGIQDLKRGMSVSVIPEGDEGYAAEDIVDWEGQFSTKFPIDAAGDSFVIRAVKKIDVTLSKGNEVIRWCYNFAACKRIEAATSSKPYILKNFETTITRYKCVSSDSSLGSQVLKSKNSVIEQAAEELIDGLTDEDEQNEDETISKQRDSI